LAEQPIGRNSFAGLGAAAETRLRGTRPCCDQMRDEIGVGAAARQTGRAPTTLRCDGDESSTHLVRRRVLCQNGTLPLSWSQQRKHRAAVANADEEMPAEWSAAAATYRII